MFISVNYFVKKCYPEAVEQTVFEYECERFKISIVWYSLTQRSR